MSHFLSELSCDLSVFMSRSISISVCVSIYLSACFSHCLFFCPTVFPPTSDLSVLLSCALLSMLLPGYQAVSHNVIALMCVRKCNSKLRLAFRSSAAILMERNSFSLSNQSRRDVGFVSCIYGERSAANP